MTTQAGDIEDQLEQTAAALRKAADEEPQQSAASKDADKPHKKPGTARGIETMFRSAYHVQIGLTALADNKANMMISINGIIISIIIAAVAPKLDANPWLLLPTTLFLVGNLVSMVFAILAAKPRVSTDHVTLGDLRHSRGNILFFGDFADLGPDRFVEGMEELLADRKLLYDTMIRNLYGLGGVLKKKFHLLQYAYIAFMIALVLGVFSFIAVFVWILR